MTKLLFVVNPVAGQVNKDEILTKVHAWAQSSEHHIETWHTTGEGDRAQLARQVEQYQPEGVVAIGGDGTLMLCAEALMHSPIKLGLIPGGSANGMATELGIPPDVAAALRIIENGHHIDADLLAFNQGKWHGLHISDVGMNANLVQQFESSERRGFLGYAQGVASQLMRPEIFHVHLQLDDREVNEVCYMVAFANASRYGTGALLSKVGRLDDGLFEVFVLKELNLTGIAGQFLDWLAENPEYFEVYQTRKAQLHLGASQWLQIDGELKRQTQEVSVEVVPGCLKLLVPG